MIFFKGLLGMVTFQVIDLSPYVAKIFRLGDNELGLVNNNLYFLGYQSQYFVLNMGNILMMLVI
jgi:hypothetical protein